MAIVPQISLISKTNVPENRITHYIVILQSGYRAFYLINWVIRFFEGYQDPIAWTAGVVQVVLSAVALQRLIATPKPVSSAPAMSGKEHLYMLYLLRFIQLASTTISGYIWCYLVWSHNNHYCAWYPWNCTDDQKQWVKVPWQFIFMIVAVRIYMKTINGN